MGTDTEPRYTLAEARQRLAEIECNRDGHELRHVRLADGMTLSVFCDRCSAVFEPPLLPPLPPENELRYDIFSAGGQTATRLTHTTTGLTATAQGGVVGRDDRRLAERLLRARLLVAQLEREANGE